ncbi:unnamed protein product [Bursaphelenchus okinawaensis]|uniref:Ferrochelatase n=1 Tax=Bursaphelenchus okinawaensis TaxID=465554 RepID=A0A811JRV0_9BILA|nr:unnamed protein product [Bursaphelenchus okinawaensis]CAG9080717.1 unnamed protein product [Bursaphelenchus okinawaensis]
MNGQLTSIRWASTGLPDFLGTALLFHHNGLPRAPFYTQKYLKGALETAGVPSSLSANLAHYRYKFSSRIRSALDQSGAFLPLDEQHRRFGKELEKALDVVLPEYKPFNVYFAHYFDEGSTENAVSSIFKNGADRLFVASIAPFESKEREELRKKKILKLLETKTRKLHDINTGKISFVGKKQPISFDYQELDNIGVHEGLVRLFAENIASTADSSDSIVFAVPLPHPWYYFQHYKQAHAACKRIVYALYEQYPRALPFRVAYYPSWDYVIPFRSLLSIKAQMKDLKRYGCSQPLVVPVGSLFADFDTQTIIPSIVGNSEIRVLRPETGDKSLVYTVTELVKTQLLTQKLIVDRSGAEPLF